MARKVNTPLAQMQSGIRSDKSKERYDYTYYDTAVLDSTAQNERMFTIPIGGAKTLSDTNMKVGGQVANGKILVAKYLKFDYISKSLKNNAGLQAIHDFYDETTLKVLIDGKEDYGTWRLSELMGAHEYIVTVPTVAGDNIAVSNMSITKGVYTLNEKIVFPSLQVFEILLNFNTLSDVLLDGDKFVVGLNGKLTSLN